MNGKQTTSFYSYFISSECELWRKHFRLLSHAEKQQNDETLDNEKKRNGQEKNMNENQFEEKFKKRKEYAKNIEELKDQMKEMFERFESKNKIKDQLFARYEMKVSFLKLKFYLTLLILFIKYFKRFQRMMSKKLSEGNVKLFQQIQGEMKGKNLVLKNL